MCGIFALLGLNNKAIDISVLINQLSARGPEGTQISKISDTLTMAFTRLAINGLSPVGMQPFKKKFEGITWMCNGEIYNARDIEDSLDTKSHPSDCYCLGDLYLRHRNDLVAFARAIDGVFSFVLYDEERDRLIVARDPYGVRPLFIATRPRAEVSYTLSQSTPETLFKISNDTICFASEIKALAPYYDNIQHFPPGYIQAFSIKKPVMLESYCYHSVPWITNPSLNSQSASEHLRFALEESVRKRMFTERPVAALLSGGLDSSLIAALVQKNLKQLNLPPLKTFSIGFKGSSDLKHAKIVADWIGSIHTEIVMTPDEFFNAIPKVIRAIESFDTTTVRASVGNYLVSQKIKELSDCKVVFNGDGSDELFGGYLYFYNAPNFQAFHSETSRLLSDIYLFDVLRSDRSISSHGLEPRTPFLDKQFVAVVRSIDPKLLTPIRGVRCEKYILRSAFDDGITLPKEVLWRRKEAFSDGVSTPDKAWYQEIQERVIHIIPENWEMKAMVSYSSYLKPLTPEDYYYRFLYSCEYGHNAAKTMVPYRWLPLWCPETVDPSARTLNIYNDTENEDAIDHENDT